MLRDDLVLFRSLPYGPSGGLAEVLADQLKRGKRHMVFHGVCTYKSQIGDACSFVDTQDDELASVTLSSDHLAPFGIRICVISQVYASWASIQPPFHLPLQSGSRQGGPSAGFHHSKPLK